MLRQAGISEQSLEVLNCDAGQPCRIRYQVDASLQEKTFSTLPELFDWVNTSSYAAKLFTPLNDKWVLVDIDRQRPGSEALLYFANGAWRLTPQEPQGRVGEELSEEIFRLARVLFSSKDLDKAWKASRSDTHWFLQTLDKFVGKTWSRLGLQAAPQRFRDFSFALGSRPDSKKILPEFLSPLHDVYLTSSDSRKLVKVPWSDPFLMMEWQAYLLHAGVEVRRDKKNPEVFLYSFKGLPLMRLTREPRRWTCEIYSPLGAKIGETSWPRPAAPKIQVRPLAGETSTYGVKIDDLEVKFRFDLAFKVPEQGIEKFAAFAGQIFAGIPRSWLRTFLTKRQEESPFYVLVSDRKSAVEKEFVSQEVAEKCGGQYQPQVNRIWIPWDEDSLRQGLLFHEVAGHVF
ncbi:MAG TPA: hypothetical protein DF383_13735, partial [Deltaproteobacteria bacterium]|nr:hypothetical protein [Deltaproteobacteria bacterium]